MNDNTVIVPARWAYPTYFSTSAYICQPNRSIRPVSHIAFYLDKQIMPEIPRIEVVRHAVVTTEAEAARYEDGDDPWGERLAAVIRWRIADHSAEWANDIYLLSAPKDQATIRLAGPIPHLKKGPWLRNQRYVSVDRLKSAITTDDLG